MRTLLVLPLLLTAPAALGDTLTVRITGIETPTGQLRVALCTKGFDAAGCPFGETRPAAVQGVQVRFADLEPATYAVAVFHDEDGDAALNRNLLGLPTEPYGFSNDAGRLAAPSFDAASFQLRGDTTIEIRVRPLFSRPAGG